MMTVSVAAPPAAPPLFQPTPEGIAFVERVIAGIELLRTGENPKRVQAALRKVAEAQRQLDEREAAVVAREKAQAAADEAAKRERAEVEATKAALAAERAKLVDWRRELSLAERPICERRNEREYDLVRRERALAHGEAKLAGDVAEYERNLAALREAVGEATE